MASLGFDPADHSLDARTPTGIGNLASQAVLAFRHHDGANQFGDEPGGTPGVAYSDYTGFIPAMRLWTSGPLRSSNGEPPEFVAAAALRRRERRGSHAALRRRAVAARDPLRPHFERAATLSDRPGAVWPERIRRAG